jgi:hypothetical protein
MFSHLDEVEMTRKYRKDHDLMGLEAEDLLAQSDGLTEQDLQAYYYPHDKEISKVGVRGIYLGNYIRWDTKAQHEKMIEMYGYESAPQQRTFDTYNDVDCQHYSGLHDHIKFLKWGYGKVVDHATRELRFRRLSREQALDLVRQYQSVPPADLQLFLDWIGIDERTLNEWVDRHRDPRVWERLPKGGWRLKSSVIDAPPPANARSVALGVVEPCRFEIAKPRAAVREDEYVLIDRGYVDRVPA